MRSRTTLTSVLMLAAGSLAHAAEPASSARPNIVLIVVDDMGWNDPGYAGNPLKPTPHLDALAARGAVFTQAYAAAPNCAPSRACLMTGLYPPRHGIYTVVDERYAAGLPWQRILPVASKTELPADALTLPKALQPAGYVSTMIGQWNLGRGRQGPGSPAGQGFTTVVQSHDLGFDPDSYWNQDRKCSTDLLTDTAIAFARDHRDQPFLIYLAYHAVHAPFAPKPELLKKFQAQVKDADQAAYAATLADVDANVRRLLDALAHQGVAQRTYVAITGDNGGLDRYVRPLRGGKGTLYEGGIRVPLVITGPGIPAGRSIADPVSFVDILPTVQAMAGLPVTGPEKIDGISLLPLVKGEVQRLAERPLFWHFPCYIGKGGPMSALRLGRYKAVQDLLSGAVAVYDLDADPGEATDLAASDPALGRKMAEQLAAMQRRLGAAMPTTPNPAYDPAAKPPRGGGKGGGGLGGRGKNQENP